MKTNHSLSYLSLAVFAPILILVGLAGFITPAQVSLTSGAPAYNVFHIIFGVVGLLVLRTRNERFINLFLFGFGLIDLYQALASYAQLPPMRYFLWTRIDDALHVFVGLALVGIGMYGSLGRKTAYPISQSNPPHGTVRGWFKSCLLRKPIIIGRGRRDLLVFAATRNTLTTIRWYAGLETSPHCP
jgi:hypothetical protein